MSRPRKQQRSHQTTSSHKKASARSRAIRLEIAPEQLIEKGNIQEAVRVLREQVQTAPSDEKRRLLGECLFDLKHYQEAAAAWLTLQEKTAGDLQSVGVAFLNAKDWEQARQFLDESVQRVENAYTYYLLALTHLRGELWYSVDIETNQKVLNLLQRARALPGCPPRGYLLLDHVLWSLACKKTEGEDEEVRDQARAQAREQCGEVLEEAFRLYPDHDQIRLEFAKSLVLVSLVNRAERSEEAVALAVYASIEAGLFEQAQHYLDLLPPPPSDEKRFSVGLDKLRGDLFLQQAKFKEALECYEKERQRGVFVARFIGTFSCAWVCLLQGQREQSIAYAEEGPTLWFEQDDLLDRFYAFDEEPICIGMHHIGDESPSLCVKQVCERLVTTLRSVPDVAKAVTSVAPILSQWHH